MKENEKISFLEEIMDVDEGELSKDMSLDDIDEWDSLSVLALITEMKTRFDISLSTKDILEFQTINDICNIIPN